VTDDRPKKSWREIDAKRDRSGGQSPGPRREESPFGGGKKGEQRQQTYRAQLDRLFESGGIGKLVADAEKHKEVERAKLLRPAAPAAPPDKPAEEVAAAPPPKPADDSRVKKLGAVRDAIGPDQITRAIDAYLKAHPWPAELDFLSAALEHRDEDIVKKALESLSLALATGKPRRAAVLAGRLRNHEELASDPEIQKKAAELRKKL
jgi:hypothetical protein